jgi:hypothetical protein
MFTSAEAVARSAGGSGRRLSPGSARRAGKRLVPSDAGSIFRSSPLHRSEPTRNYSDTLRRSKADSPPLSGTPVSCSPASHRQDGARRWVSRKGASSPLGQTPNPVRGPAVPAEGTTPDYRRLVAGRCSATPSVAQAFRRAPVRRCPHTAASWREHHASEANRTSTTRHHCGAFPLGDAQTSRGHHPAVQVSPGASDRPPRRGAYALDETPGLGPC